ncbi:hypothetical protein DDN72_17675 [Vibrio cholerae]|nr:hypothetical protein [Vibrio cholerae]
MIKTSEYKLAFSNKLSKSKIAEIFKPNSPLLLKYDEYTVDGRISPDAYVFTEHQIVIDYRSDETKSLNYANVTVYNPDEEIARWLESSQGVLAYLSVGTNEALEQLIVGSVSDVQILRDNENILLKFAIRDSAVTQKEGFVSKSWPRGTTVSTIVDEIARELGLPVAEINVSPEVLNKTLDCPKAIVAHTPQALNTLIEEMVKGQRGEKDVKVYTQNGELKVRETKRRKGTTSAVITPLNGLMSFNVSKDMKGEVSYNLQTLAIPYKVGDQIEVQDFKVFEPNTLESKGTFIVTSLVFQGDLYGGTWMKAANLERIES